MRQFISPNIDRLSRRDFLKLTAGLGLSAAGMTLLNACNLSRDVPTETLETTTIKIPLAVTLCVAPQYLAEDLLKSEGFTDVQYVNVTSGQVIKNLVSGDVNIALYFGAPAMVEVARGAPITLLG